MGEISMDRVTLSIDSDFKKELDGAYEKGDFVGYVLLATTGWVLVNIIPLIALIVGNRESWVASSLYVMSVVYIPAIMLVSLLEISSSKSVAKKYSSQLIAYNALKNGTDGLSAEYGMTDWVVTDTNNDIKCVVGADMSFGVENLDIVEISRDGVMVKCSDERLKKLVAKKIIGE